MTREEIIEGLRGIHAVTANYKGDQVILHNTPMPKLTGILYGAAELLKAQEPRVLTLNEIPEHDGAVFIEYDPEDMSDEWMLFYAEHKPYLEFVNAREGRVYLATGTYNNIWRAWTYRPSAAQMKAEQWEAAP